MMSDGSWCSSVSATAAVAQMEQNIDKSNEMLESEQTQTVRIELKQLN